MSDIKIEGFSLVLYDDAGKKHELFDGVHTYRNVSHITTQSFEGSKAGIEYLIDIQDEYNNIALGSSEHTIIPLIINSIIANYLVEREDSVKALEIGASTGYMSWNLIKILELFNKESTLVCVIDNYDSINNWRMITAQESDKIKTSLLISEYDNLQLAENSFDIAVINGNAYINNAPTLLKYVTDYISEKGILVIYAKESIFETDMELVNIAYNFEKIVVSPEEAIYLIKKENVLPKETDYYEDLIHSIKEEYAKMRESNNYQNADELIERITKAIDISIEKKEADVKIELIDIRRDIINKLPAVAGL